MKFWPVNRDQNLCDMDADQCQNKEVNNDTCPPLFGHPDDYRYAQANQRPGRKFKYGEETSLFGLERQHDASEQRPASQGAQLLWHANG